VRLKRAERVSRGSGLLFRPGDKVKGSHNPAKPLRVFACHFKLPAAESKELIQSLPRWFQCHDALRFEQSIMELLESQRGQNQEKGLRLRLAMLLLQATRDAATKTLDPVEKNLRSLCVEIAADPGRAWLPEQMATRSSLSLPQFNRRFRALVGTSPLRYIIAQRIDRAQQLLLESPMSLQDISSALGYQDIYYFHRQFRAETGQTPRNFQKKHKS
jgi:AraC family transcriptional regulator, arabinose operon regulatory protein